jgi:hypothetical protein
MGADGIDLPCPGSSKVAEGARFENLDGSETIVPDLASSFRPQSLAEEADKARLFRQFSVWFIDQLSS